MNSAPKPGSRRYSTEEWEAQKVNIERLYVTENRPLKEVIHVLNQDFGFTARYGFPFGFHSKPISKFLTVRSSLRAGSQNGVSTSRISRVIQ
jgi:hypothetical protein